MEQKTAPEVEAILAQGKHIGECHNALRLAIEALALFATDENPQGCHAIHALNECKKLLPEYWTKD